jgi:hypothetical protein
MTTGTSRTPDERRALITILRGLKILQRARPDVFNHAARGLGFYLDLQVGTPEARALAQTLWRQFPAA